MVYLALFLLPLLSWSVALTPTQIGNYAQDRAPHLKVYLESQNSSQSLVKQSKLLPNPVFTVQSGSLKSGTQAGPVVDLTINQPIPWPGKREAFRRSQEFLYKISQLEMDQAKLMLASRVSLLAIQYDSAQSMEKHNAERKRHFSLIHRHLSSRPLASPKQQVDKDLVETQIKRIEMTMNDLTAHREALMEELKLWTGLDDVSVKMNWEELPPLPNKERYLVLLNNSLAVKRLGMLQDLSENKVEEARLLARPDIFMGVNYRQENIAPTNHFYHAQVSVVIPIIDRGQHTVEAARAIVRKEEANKNMMVQESSAEIHRLFAYLESAHKSTTLFDIKTLQALENRFTNAEKAFLKGQVDVMTYLQTDAQIHDSVDAVYNSRVEYLSYLSQLELMIGKKLEI